MKYPSPSLPGLLTFERIFQWCRPICIAAFVLVPALSLPQPVDAEVIGDAAPPPRAESPQKNNVAEQFAGLQKELAELQSHLPDNFRIRHWWGDDPAIRRVAATRSRQLSRDVVRFAFDHPDFALESSAGWYRLYSDATRLDQAFNVTGDPEDAVAHAKERLTQLAEVREHIPPQLHEQVLIFPVDFLLTRIAEKAPHAAVDLIEFTERVLEAGLAPGSQLRPRWLRVKAKRGRYVIDRYPDPGGEPWVLTMLGWWREFLEDDTALMLHKEQEIISLAIALHTRGRSDEGLRWLRWLEAQPDFEAWDSMSWLSHAFFASWIGLGERELGQRYFNRIQHLMEQGQVRGGNELFRGVTSSYYSQLHKSDVQHRMDALRETAARFERSFPDARR